MKDSKLNMYGGAIGGSFPLLIFIVGMIVLTFSGKGGMSSFWAIGWLAFFSESSWQKIKVTTVLHL